MDVIIYIIDDKISLHLMMKRRGHSKSWFADIDILEHSLGFRQRCFSDLKKLISDIEAMDMNSKIRLSSLLLTNYNAVPQGGHVELNLNGLICKLILNSGRPEL
jgi:hypothetical protein